MICTPAGMGWEIHGAFVLQIVKDGIEIFIYRGT